MFGRVAKLPIDINTETCDPEERVEEFERRSDPNEEEKECERNAMHYMIKSNISKAQKKQKEYYDMKHKVAICFDVGSIVLKKDFTRKKRKGGKLDYRWNGPYKIVASLGRGLFRLKANNTGKV